jgi:BASS family bile acid:Na+ symporter
VINNVLIPATLTSMMIIVGTGLQPEAFRSLLRSPLALAGGTLSQTMLLPMGALALIFLMKPSSELAAGLILVAACPGGAISNFYCHFARLNVALSVMLTAITSILSFALLPLILAITFPVIALDRAVEVPVVALSLQLFLFVFVPIGIGMVFSFYFPQAAERHARLLRGIGLMLLLMLLTFILVAQWETVWQLSGDAAVLAIAFTAFAALAGWVTALALGLELKDRTVFAIEFSVRNLAAAVLVAVSSLARPDFAAFGVLFVIVQFPLIVALLYLYRRKQTG